MPLLTIELLDHPRVSLAGRLLDVRVRKELALLAYLVVEQEHCHSRDSLLGLLWPDVTEEAARNNLRVVRAGLRRVLGAASDALLLAERQHVQFLPHSDHTLDVIIFCRLLRDVRAHAHAAVERCEACVARLAEAAEIYRGDFLAGFGLAGSAPFEEWATVVCEQLHQQALRTGHLSAHRARTTLGRGAPAQPHPFLVDAAHFVHGTFVGMVWCFVRYCMPTPSGRKRFTLPA